MTGVDAAKSTADAGAGAWLPRKAASRASPELSLCEAASMASPELSSCEAATMGSPELSLCARLRGRLRAEPSSVPVSTSRSRLLQLRALCPGHKQTLQRARARAALASDARPGHCVTLWPRCLQALQRGLLAPSGFLPHVVRVWPGCLQALQSRGFRALSGRLGHVLHMWPGCLQALQRRGFQALSGRLGHVLRVCPHCLHQLHARCRRRMGHGAARAVTTHTRCGYSMGTGPQCGKRRTACGSSVGPAAVANLLNFETFAMPSSTAAAWR